MVKRYIEFDLPLKEISHYSAIEKNTRHGNPSSLLKWWARKPLAASRVTAFASLIKVSDINKDGIDQLLIKLCPWDNVKKPNTRLIENTKKKLKYEWEHTPKILDPFAGGGSIPLEALRLGCEVYSSDLNPVAIMIQKATLEWPQKFNQKTTIENTDQKTFLGINQEENVLMYMYEKWGKIIENEVYDEIGHYYPKDNNGNISVGYLWFKYIPCINPTCKKDFPLTQQFWLAKYDGKNKDKSVALKMEVGKNDIKYKILAGNNIDFDPSKGTISNKKAKCPFCNQVLKQNEIRKMASINLMYNKLIVCIYHKKTGKSYELATENDINIYESTQNKLEEIIKSWTYLETPLPEEEMRPHPRYMTPYYYGMKKWKDIYNTRQQLALLSFVKSIKDNFLNIEHECKKISQNIDIDYLELTKAVIGYLTINLCRLSEYSSTLCGLNSTGGRGVRGTFVRTALPINWNFMESNVFNPEGASWPSGIESILKVINHRHLILIYQYTFKSQMQQICPMKVNILMLYSQIRLIMIMFLMLIFLIISMFG